MEKLSLAQLRMILRAMSPHELEDMVCALYRSSGEAAAFFNRCYNTEEYVERLVDTYKAKLQIQFSCMGSCGSLAAARRSLNEFTRAVFEPRAALEMMLYCLEKATKWAGDGEIPVSACEDMVEIFREFVERLNQLNLSLIHISQALLGIQGVIQHHHVKARAAYVHKQAVVHHAGVDGPGGMGEDEVQRILPVFRGSNAFDKIVTGSGRGNAQRRCGMPQPLRRFGDGTVATHGDHGIHAAPGRVPRKVGCMSGMVGQLRDKFHVTLPEVGGRLLAGLPRAPIAGDGIDNQFDHGSTGLSYWRNQAILPHLRKKGKHKLFCRLSFC